jgi:hypothetical protein
MDHLSPEWIAAFDAIVRDHAGLRAASADRRVVISYTVTGAPGDAGGATGSGTYTLVLDHGDNRVLDGPHADPDITFATDRVTAAAIASHDESAQRAFMAGRLRLGGDVRVLMANQDLLAEIDDCTVALRSPAAAAGSGA